MSFVQSIKHMLRSSPVLYRLGRTVYASIYKMRYLFLKKRCNTDKHLVYFDAYWGSSYACSPRAIYEQMLSDPTFEDYRFVWIFKEPGKHPAFREDPRTQTVRWLSNEHLRAWATAGTVVTNSMLPLYVDLKPDQLLLETWHGTPLKRLGCDIALESSEDDRLEGIHKRYRIVGNRVGYMPSPSRFYSETIASAFSLTPERAADILHPVGYPRNDILVHPDPSRIKSIKASLGLDPERKVILYAPTFRDNQRQDHQYVFSLPLNLEQFGKVFGDHVQLLIRTHYFVASKLGDLSSYRWITDVSTYDDISDLYLISDLLITDYSSVFFDYAILRRPILFFMPDLDAYRNEIRDFYFDLTELPGPITQTQDALQALIPHALQQEAVTDTQREIFLSKFAEYEDGHAAEHVIRDIFIDH